MAEVEQSEVEKLQEFIRDQVKQAASELAAQQPPQSTTPAVDPQVQARQELKQQYIDPLVQPDIAAARFQGQNAMDYADFYMSNPDAVEYKEQVETIFKQLAEQGRTLPRRDILDHVVGREMRTDPTKFAEKQAAKRQRELDRANAASDYGASSVERQKADNDFKKFAAVLNEGSIENVSEAVKEMEAALQGVAF